jgi:hypothetical protein
MDADVSTDDVTLYGNVELRATLWYAHSGVG